MTDREPAVQPFFRPNATVRMDASQLFERAPLRPPFQVQGSVPIIFSPNYDFSLPATACPKAFDLKKRGKIFAELQHVLEFETPQTFAPRPADERDLRLVHSEGYLRALRDPRYVANVMGWPELAQLSEETLENGLLLPKRYATGGTILAVELARTRGWAVNLSGGFHHAHAARGEGFCFYADCAIALRRHLLHHPDERVLIVDLDAHPGNGVAALLGEDPRITILDIYRRGSFPLSPEVTRRMHFRAEVQPHISDEQYLTVAEELLQHALRAAMPHLVFYNAGCDVAQADRLGRMSLSEDAVRIRDELVFRSAFNAGAPVAMVLSGGYGEHVPTLVSSSIAGLAKALLRFDPSA